MLRTLRLDASDQVVFSRAAAPGEWAVPGGFAFWDEDAANLSGKRRQEFRAGFLGLGSFGFSTLVEVAEATEADHQAALDSLTSHILSDYGAPGMAEARAAAAEELAFAESLCDHPPGTVVALQRVVEGGEQKERFRTLHRRDTAPVFAVVEEEAEPEAVDLQRLKL